MKTIVTETGQKNRLLSDFLCSEFDKDLRRAYNKDV